MKFSKWTSIVFISSVFLLSNNILSAQPNVWNQIDPSSIQELNRRIKPDKFALMQLDQDGIRNFLFSLTSDPSQGKLLLIPNPNGKLEAFKVWESPMMEEELANKFSEIKTYTASKVDDPYVTAKLDYTVYGFHGIVFSNEGSYYIDPVNFKGSSQYQVYYKSDFQPSDKSRTPCHFGDPQMPGLIEESNRIAIENNDGLPHLQRTHGNQKKTYRLALACTGEYAQAVTGSSSPTKAEVLSAMVTTMNRVNGIYEREVSVHMNIIANNEDIIYTSPSSDPYNYNFNGYMLMDENQENIESVIGLTSFDIGHVFSTGGGGIAALGSVCYTNYKAQGVTGSDMPYGDPYDVDYVAHEMGHQFGANHTFNNCFGNENDPTAFEPGSGSTIMGYAGICGTENNLQNNSDDYFHPASLDEISEFITSLSSCGTTALGSTMIDVPEYSGTYHIPTNTAFELVAPEATWTSPDLRYGWNQSNLGQVGRTENTGTSATSAPIFRSYKPELDGRYRSFPKSSLVHNNTYSAKGERTPNVERSVKTRLVVRGIAADGYGSFNTMENEITVNYHNTGAPFSVITPNTEDVTWSTGSTQTVTWQVAGTIDAPINTSNVTILLSRDGGASYPNILAASVPNSGTATITIPEGMATTQARVKVKGLDNVFYDVSDDDFTITGTSMSIDQNSFISFFNVYPNPVTDNLFIEPIGKYTDLDISVFNVLGQKIYDDFNSDKTSINTYQWSEGVYIIEIKDQWSDARGTFKVVKLK